MGPSENLPHYQMIVMEVEMMRKLHIIFTALAVWTCGYYPFVGLKNRCHKTGKV